MVVLGCGVVQLGVVGDGAVLVLGGQLGAMRGEPVRRGDLFVRVV